MPWKIDYLYKVRLKWSKWVRTSANEQLALMNVNDVANHLMKQVVHSFVLVCSVSNLFNTRRGTFADSPCVNNLPKTYHLTHWFVLPVWKAARMETDVVPLVSRKRAFLRELIIRRARLLFVSDNRISSARHRVRLSQRGRDRIPTLVY